MQRREFLSAIGAAILFPKKLASLAPEPIPAQRDYSGIGKCDPPVEINISRTYCYFRLIDREHQVLVLGVLP